MVSEPLSRVVFVEFPVCMRMVLDYFRYLFCCALVLICWLVLCRNEMAGGRDDAKGRLEAGVEVVTWARLRVNF